MKAVAIVQARMGSTRLPGKVLRPLAGKPMLWHILQRLRAAKGVDEVVVATSDQPGDTPIAACCDGASIALFRGSEHDVLDRFHQAAASFNGDPVLRVTGDCPLVDPVLVTRVLALYRTGEYDHVGVATGAGAAKLDSGRFPDGLDAECFGFDLLHDAWQNATEPSDREHVTPYFWRVPGRCRVGMLISDRDYSDLRWTVDNEADFQLISRIYTALYDPRRPFVMEDVLRFLAENPELARLNRHFVGEEGYMRVWNPETPQGGPPAEEA